MMMFLYQKKTPIKYKEGQFIGYGKSSLLELGDDETMRVIINTIEYLDEKDDFVIWQ